MPMFEPFIIWGSAGHSMVLADLIEQRNGHVIALFDNDNSAISSLDSVPLYYGVSGFEQWVQEQESLDNIKVALAIGGSRGQDRQTIAKLFENYKLTIPVLIHSSAVVSKFCEIGMGCQILANTVIAANAKLENLCIINNSANIDHECELNTAVHVAPGATLCGCVSVGENAFIGAGSTILPRITIGKNTIIGAGAVVTKNFPDNVIVAGNPARIIGEKSA